MRKHLLTALLCLSGMHSFPALAEKDCESGASNMAEVRACIEDNADERLESTFNRTEQHIRAKNPEAADLLITAQQSWKKFAEDSCTFSVAARNNDMPANDASLECWQAFTEARIKILDMYQRKF